MKSPRRNLVGLAKAIALRLFHPQEGPFADRLELKTNDGREHGGWGLPNARKVIYDVLRHHRRPRRKRPSRRRER